MRLILMRTSVEKPVLHNKDPSSYRPGLGMCDDVCEIDADIFAPWIGVDWKVRVCPRASSIASKSCS